MKKLTLLNLFFPGAAWLALAAGVRLAAVPLPAAAEVHVQPDAGSPVLQVLPVGSEPFAATGVAAPAGWQAVTLPGAHEVLVHNGDLLKDLTPRPGASYLWRPAGAKAGATVEVATAERGDLAVIIGLQGGYTKIRLSKPLVGYIVASAMSPVEPPAPVSAVVAVPPPVVAPVPDVVSVPSPVVSSVATPATGPVAPAPVPTKGDGGDSPRLFQGTLTSTRSLLHPRRPYDYQLNDINGQPYAYLDIRKLTATTQPDADLGRTVVVYGVARSEPDEVLMVIAAETIDAR